MFAICLMNNLDHGANHYSLHPITKSLSPYFYLHVVKRIHKNLEIMLSLSCTDEIFCEKFLITRKNHKPQRHAKNCKNYDSAFPLVFA